jgi:hypothetical protein
MEKDEPDLTGVHPLFWEKTRARIAAIEEYLKLNPVRAEDEERLARRVGLSAPHFRRLARIWMRHRRADMIPGSTGKRIMHPAHRQRLAPGAQAIVEKVITDLGERAAVPEVASEVSRRRAEQGVVPPHPITIRHRLEEAWVNRDVRVDQYVEPALVIDHCAIDLPTRTECGTLIVPVVSVAILVPELTIVAHSVALHTPTPQASARVLLGTLQAMTADVPLRPLEMAQGRTDGWRNLAKLLQQNGIRPEGRSAVQVPSGRALTKLIGHELGELTLRPNLTHRPGAITRRSIREMPAADLPAAIAQAITDHNRTRAMENCPPPFRITHLTVERLSARLRGFAEQRLEPQRPRPRYDRIAESR